MTNSFWQGVTIGAVAGVISGIVFGILGWLKGVVQRWTERRGEIGHLAGTIEHYRELIFGATDLDFRNHPIQRRFARDEVTKTYLTDMHGEIQAILLGRAKRLSFDEIREIKEVFFPVEQYPDWIPNDQGYEVIFGKLESIAWLRLKRH